MKCPLFFRILALAAALAASLAAGTAHAQDRPSVIDVLTLDATVSTEVTPDLAVVMLTAVREGADASALSQEVNQTIARAIAVAKATAGMTVASAGYSTTPRSDNKGQRIGWQVRAGMIVKSRDFTALGKLAGQLSAGDGAPQITGTYFELSPELRASEETGLIDRAAAEFKAKASAAAKAFGYGSYTIREIRLGSPALGPQPRIAGVATFAAEARSPTPMPIEGGRVTLQLTVSGSVQMRNKASARASDAGTQATRGVSYYRGRWQGDAADVSLINQSRPGSADGF